jgi:ammonia channel protein AmtB
VGGKFSYTMVGLGSLFCWIFFPFFNLDIPTSLLYSNQAGLATFYCISSCVLTCIGLSCMITGSLNLKDLLYSPVVGGVIIGSSAVVIHQPMSAILLGVIGGFCHFWLLRL